MQCVCVDVQADELNLLEDGLQLWLIALRNAPSSQAGSALLHLFPNLTAVMQRSTGLPPAQPSPAQPSPAQSNPYPPLLNPPPALPGSTHPLPPVAHLCPTLSVSVCLPVRLSVRPSTQLTVRESVPLAVHAPSHAFL